MSVVARMIATASRGEGIQAAAVEEQVMGLRRSLSSGEGAQSVAQRLNQLSTPPSSPHDKRVMTVLQHRERENRTRDASERKNELPLAIALSLRHAPSLRSPCAAHGCASCPPVCAWLHVQSHMREMKSVGRCRNAVNGAGTLHGAR